MRYYEVDEKYYTITDKGILWGKLHLDWHIPSFIAEFICNLVYRNK